MQAIDLSLLDLEHARYDKREIVASCIYIQIGLFFNIFTRDIISMTPDL